MATLLRVSAIGLLSLLCVQLATAQTNQSPATYLGESLIGRDSYHSYCSSCHGPAGRGDGPIAEALKRRPADLTALAARNDNRFPRERVTRVLTGEGRTVAAHGPTEMPIWGPLFRVFESDARVRVRIDNLVSYIETLQAGGRGGESGAMLFRTYCASCHGADARGDGPAAAAMRTLPPDLTTYARRNGGVFPSERLRQIIDGRGIPAHGDRDMPVWGHTFYRTPGGPSEDTVKARIKAITDYLEAIQERVAE